MLNCLSPSTSLNVTSVPPKRSPPLVTPSATGGRPSRNSFSNVPFLWIFALTSVCDCGGVKSIGSASGDPKSDVATVCSGFLARQRVDAVLALVVGDEGDLGRLLIAQHDRRDVAGQRVRVLLQLATLQVQRPDVVDVAVARHFRIDRLIRIDRGRGEHDRVGVDELRAAIVVRAERDLGLLRRCRDRP